MISFDDMLKIADIIYIEFLYRSHSLVISLVDNFRHPY